jgi:hypothetical protein
MPIALTTRRPAAARGRSARTPPAVPFAECGVNCERRLGGLLKHYCRAWWVTLQTGSRPLVRDRYARLVRFAFQPPQGIDYGSLLAITRLTSRSEVRLQN